MPKATSEELPILTRVESELMAVFWRDGALTVAQLLEKLDRPLAYTSALTIVRILEKKGYLTHEKAAEGRAHIFAPAVAEKKVRKRHLRDLVDRLFGGRTTDLVAGLLEEEKLSREELEALRQEIDAKLASQPKDRKR